MTRRLAAFLLALLTAFSAVGAATAAIELDQAPLQLKEWERSIDRILREVGVLRLSEAAIQSLNAQALAIKASSGELRDAAREAVEEAKGLLEALGKPAEGQTEAEEMAQKRKQLTADLQRADGWVHQAELILEKTERALDQLSTKRIEALARALREVKPSPLDPRNWASAWNEAALVASISKLTLVVWVKRMIEGEPGVASGALFMALLAAVGFGAGWLARRGAGPIRAHLGLSWGAGEPPHFPRRASAAALDVGIALLPWSLALLFAWRALPDESLLPNGIARALVAALAFGALVYAVLRAIVARVVAPHASAWRLASLDDARAAELAPAFNRLAAVVAANGTFCRAAASLYGIDHVVSIWALLASVAFVYAVRAIWRRAEWQGGQGWRVLRVVGTIGAVLGAIAAALGFSALAQYLVNGIVGTALVLGLGVVFRRVAREGMPQLFDPQGRAGQAMTRAVSLAPETLRLVEFWLSLVVEFAIFVAIVVGLLLIWGATIDDLFVFWTRLVDGVRIGSYTFSLADVMIALSAFVIVLTLTRYLQRVLDTRIFPRTSLDLGVRNSLRSGVGYVGLVIAASTAVSTLGLNISNLAFVAGALSVGIGFGLQNIVNNFVSGLILLVERPIKQGDWIVAGPHQGIVKRINVRATEIETFSRSTVLVPNAEFLQQHVVNWTHRDLAARAEVTVPVPIVLGSAAAIRDALLACTRDLPGALREPPPSVHFKELALDHYVFEVFVQVGDAFRRGGVASELRYRIDATLRETFPDRGAPAPVAPVVAPRA